MPTNRLFSWIYFSALLSTSLVYLRLMCTVQRRNGVNIKPGRSINSIFPYNDFSLLLPSECSSSPILQYRLAVATTSATLDSSFDILKPIRSGSSLIPTSHCFNSTKRSINRFGQHIFNYNTKWDILGKNQQFFNAISELEILSRQQQRRAPQPRIPCNYKFLIDQASDRRGVSFQ